MSKADNWGEALTRLRAGEMFRCELENKTFEQAGALFERPVLSVYLLTPRGSWSRKPYLALVPKLEDPNQDESFSSLLRSLSRLISPPEVQQ